MNNMNVNGNDGFIQTLYISILLLLGYVLIVISGFRLFGEDTDFRHYFNLFSYGYDPQGSTKELAFVFFRYLVNDYFNANFYIFLFIYTFLGVSLKFFGIMKYSLLPFLSIFLYLFIYFPLHEYTQIRVGVAAGILIFAIGDMARKNIFAFIFKIILATMFHWISLAAFFLYPLYRYFPQKYIYLLPVIGIFISLNADLVRNIVEYIFSLNEYLAVYYKNHAGHTEVFNVFNTIFILDLLIWLVIFLIVPRDTLLEKNFFTAFYTVFTISIFIYLATSPLNLPVISHRLFEFFNISLIIVIPNFIYILRRQVIPILLLAIYVGAIFYHLLFGVHIFPNLI